MENAVTETSVNRLPRLQSAKVEEVEISREYKSGAKYVGPVQDNKKIGRGVFVWPNGARYEGEFTDNVRHGKGCQYWADGSKFNGDFVQDLRHGEGDHEWANGERYSGQFFKDRRHGSGTYTWPDGSNYHGTFYMDRKEGYGMFVFANGNRFQGLYKDDEREGPGILTYTDGRRDVGLWHRERLVQICTSIEGAFTMKDHPEFDYVVEEHINHIIPRNVTNRTEVFHHIINPPEQFNYLRDDNVTPDTDSIFSETLDSRSLAADIQTFDAAFFKDMMEDNNNKDKLSAPIKAWNNTPSCMSMQTHILRHRHAKSKLDWKVDDILNGNRGKKEDKGPIEIASETLIKAAAAGDVRTVADLLHTGEVFVDVADRNGHTALLSAAVNWHQDVINCLLDNGADVNKLNNEGVSALAACHVFFYPVESFCYNIAERYMEKPPDVDTEETESKKDMKGILSSRSKSQENGSVNGDIISSKSKISLDSGLHDPAIESPQDQKLKVRIMETGLPDPLEAVENEKNRKLGVLEFKRHHKNIHNLTLDDQTTRNGDVDSLYGSERDNVSLTSDFESNVSVRNYEIHVSDQLIDRCATQLSMNEMVVSRSRQSSADIPGTARSLAVQKSHHALMESTIRLLLRRGADPNASSVPMPVLFFAIKAADVDAVRLLLLKGASTNARLSPTKGGLAPLHIAAAIPGEEGVQITELLLNSLASPDVRATEDDAFLNTSLQDEWSKDVIDEKSEVILGGRTPLHIACARDDHYKNAYRVVHLLLDHHANPNLLCNGHSPLALAIASGNDMAVDDLLLYGADPSLPLTHGVGSALCIASSTEYEHRRTPQGRIQLVDKLIKAGADILAPILIGSKRISGTAVDYAYHMFNLDRRIAHMPYHALTPAERETYNARRKLLGHLGDILRTKAVVRERQRMEEEEQEGFRSASPSPNFVYTGAGAPLPPGIMKGRKGLAESSRVSFGGRGASESIEPGQVSSAGVVTAMERDVRKLHSNLSRRKTPATRKPLFKYCYECGRSVGVRLSPCTRCKEVFYCSKACKLKAWNARHKEECVRVGAHSRSPSPTRGGKRIDSPTPVTDAEKRPVGGVTVTSLTDPKNLRVKVPFHGRSISARDQRGRMNGKSFGRSAKSGGSSPSPERLYKDNYSFV